MLHRSKICERYAWAALIAIVAAWIALLFFQRGQTWDEGEHAHVAWLISQGKRPLDDFFQHHQPLLWSLLALYFRVGLTGPRVLIWGRVLVLLSGLVSVIALLRLGRLHSPSSQRLAGWLGVGAFIGLTFMVPTLFVSRPETISTAAFLAALALWNEPEGHRWDTAIAPLAGLLAGAAVYSSPRFALLGGLFAFSGTQGVRRWFALVAGGIGFVAAYTIASGFPLDKVVFNLEFSAYLQSVGNKLRGAFPGFWILLMTVVCSFMTALLLVMRRGDRRRGAALLGYAVIVFLICRHVAGLYQYSQAFAPFIVVVAIACAWIGARLQWPSEPSAVLASIAAAMLLVHGLSLPEFAFGIPHLDFLTFVRFRERLAQSIPPGSTTLVYSRDSPITVPDASYYMFPLGDSPDRLCTAVQGFRSKWKLPPCDYLSVLLDQKPYLTEEWFGQFVPKAEAKRAADIVKKFYSPVFRGGGSTPRVRTGIMRLNDAGDVDANWAATVPGKTALR